MHNSNLAPPIFPVSPGSALGLVTSATIPQDSKAVRELLDGLGSLFRFPSAEMCASAASLFVRDSPTVPKLHSVPGAPMFGQYAAVREGPLSFLTVAPGLVKLARVDLNRQELRNAAELQRRRDVVERDRLQWRQPMALASFSWETVPSGRTVSVWSAKSRARLIASVASLDLSVLTSGAVIPCMVTLTLPGDWLAVAPTAAAAAKHLDRLERAWRHQWGSAPQWIWKREFQGRGAPHWHVWTVPPTSDAGAFRAWLSSTWTAIISPSAVPDEGLTHEGLRCVCSEWCRSLAAGTGVDFAEGLRARDPRRLAVYFLKETLGGESKAYQNLPPAEWAGQSVGRFWGMRGLKNAGTTVQISPVEHVRAWRFVERVRVSRSPVRVVRVQRVHARTGGIFARSVSRRRVVYGDAGWVAVNDGAAFASQIARALAVPAPPETVVVRGHVVTRWAVRSPATMPGGVRVSSGGLLGTALRGAGETVPLGVPA